MKKIFIIALSILSLCLYGQSKTVQGRLEPITTNVEAVEATASNNTSSISSLTNNTSGVSGLTFSNDGDTLFFSVAGNTWWVLSGGAEEADITAPTVLSAELGTYANDTILVSMSEALETDSIPSGAFTFTEDGNAYGIGTAGFYSDSIIKIPLDSVGEAEKAYLLSYSRPGASDFQDPSGNKLATFSSRGVTNNITLASDIYAYMLFEGDDTDSMGVMTFTWTGTEAYKTTGSPPQGTYSTDTPGLTYLTTNETHDLGDYWTVSGWFLGGDNARRTLFALDGADVYFDYTDSDQYLEGTVGGQAFQSDQIPDVGVEYQWTHMAVTYDGIGNGTNGYLRTYVDGANVSNDSLVATGADANGIINILFNGSGFAFYGDVDDLHFYKAVLTDAQILELYNNPGIPIGGKTDPPIPNDLVDVIYVEDFEDFSVTALHTATSPVGVPNTTLAANITNFESLGSDSGNDPNKADNIDIVLFDGSNAMKSWYPEGQCCWGDSYDYPFNGGTGVDLYAYINSDKSDETEIYVSWNEYVYDNFNNSHGFKQPGVITSKDTYYHGTSRQMVNDYAGYDLNQGQYVIGFYNGFDVQTTNKTIRWNENIPTGRWVNKTVRSYSGTAGSNNGLVELFVDGVIVGSITSIPFRRSGDDGWVIFNITTFMGGSGAEYISPIDQWILYDEFVIFQFKSGADVVRGSTPSATGRDISGTLKSIGDLGFPR